MPMYDRQCVNGHTKLDCWEPIHYELEPLCTECGEPMRRGIYTSAKTNAVKADSIPGGLWIRNGLCNADGSPRRYDSFTEIRREAEKRGLVNKVVHQPDPRSGSDKSAHTVRWASVDTTNYDDPAVRDQRRRDMAAWLGVSMEEYERITNPIPSGSYLPMDDVEFAIRHEVSQWCLAHPD